MLDDGDLLELRAAQGARPVIRLLNWYGNRPDSLRVRGAPPPEPEECSEAPSRARPPRLILDGLQGTGRGIRVSGVVGRVTIRHCTLVPGWSTGGDCGPENRGEPSLELVDTGARVTVERSILGGILVNQNEVDTEPITVELRDSILDATGPDHDALAGPNGRYAHAVAGIVRCTVFGPRAGARHRAGRGHDLRRPRPGRPPPGRLHAVLLRPAGLPYSRRSLCQPYLVVTADRRRLEAGELTAA